MRVAKYLRKSRADDRNEPIEVTLARHNKILDELIEKQRLSVVETYREVVSGESIVARPQMMQMLERVEAGDFDAVVCMDIDRLGRGGMKDQGLIIETFKYSDTKIITPEKTYDLANDLDEQMTEFKTFMSRQEYKIINKRLRRGLNQILSEGAYVANPPFGYRKVYLGKLPSLEIVEEEAQYIRMIYDMYVNQMLGSYTIANTLNDLGVVPRRNAQFSRNTVRMILKNPVYTGHVVWNRVTRKKAPSGKVVATYHPMESWTIHTGLHPAIIDQEMFDRAQDIRQTRVLPAYNKGECKNQMAGIIYCGQCGKHMQRQVCRGRWDYLRCMSTSCSGSASFLDVQEALIEHLEQQMLQLQLESVNHTCDTSRPDAILEATQRERTAVMEQRERLLTLLEQGVYSVDLFQERMVTITQRLASLEAKAKAAAAERDRILHNNPLDLAQKIKDVLDTYESVDIPQKNRLLKSIIERVTYTRDKGIKQQFELVVTLKTF